MSKREEERIIDLQIQAQLVMEERLNKKDFPAPAGSTIRSKDDNKYTGAVSAPGESFSLI